MKKIGLVLFVLTLALTMNAQKLVGVGKLIQGGIDDGEKLLNAYLLPLNRAMIVGLNNSGFNGFYDGDKEYRMSLALNISWISIPNKYKTFDVNQLDLVSVEAKDSKNTLAQTAFGDSSSIKLVSKYGVGSLRYFSINTEPGSTQNAIPLPYIKGSFQTDKVNISVQVIPPVTLPQTDIKAWLVGGDIQTSMSGWFSGLEALPFDLQLGGGAFIFRAHSDLDVKPGDVKVNVPLTIDAKGPYDNQELRITYSGIYATLYATGHLGIFTPFIGAGFNTGVSSFKIKGTYPIYVKAPSGIVGLRAEDVEDPVSNTEAYARIKLEAGGRFDFGRFFAQASYTLAAFGGMGGSVGVRF